MKPPYFEVLLFICMLLLLFTPLLEINYRYTWDPFSGKLATDIRDLGLIKNLWKQFTNDYETIKISSFNFKFPIIFLGLVIQLLFILKKSIFKKYSIWVYLGVLIFYGVNLLILTFSFESHRVYIKLEVGSYLFFSLIILGIIREVLIKKND